MDVDGLLLCQPDSGEMALEVVDQLIRSSSVDIIVVDSVAALVPQAELEGEVGQVLSAHIPLNNRTHHQRCLSFILTPLLIKVSCSFLLFVAPVALNYSCLRSFDPHLEHDGCIIFLSIPVDLHTSVWDGSGR